MTTAHNAYLQSLKATGSTGTPQPGLVPYVLKAVDLNMLRANRFIDFATTGKGENPVDEFFKQYPANPNSPPAQERR